MAGEGRVLKVLNVDAAEETTDGLSTESFLVCMFYDRGAGIAWIFLGNVNAK